MNQVFLDCDGVLADFDRAARQIFGMESREAEDLLGEEEFWRCIRTSGKFYRDLPLLPDALELYRAVEHLHPVILTGCPRGGWSEPQKVAWAEQHFPGVHVITCASRDKVLHMKHTGDVLVDDYLKYRKLWEQAGGIFVHHISAQQSIQCLRELGFDVKPPQSGDLATEAPGR